MLTVTWERQATEQVEFVLDDEGGFVDVAFVVVDGKLECGEEHREAALAAYEAICELLDRAKDLEPFRLVAKSAGAGTAVVLYGPVAKAKSRGIDVEGDTALGTLLEAASRIVGASARAADAR